MKAWQIFIISSILVGFLIGCQGERPEENPESVADTEVEDGETGSFGCSINIPTLTSELPSDVIVKTQTEVNCFAWRNFISLNWQASGSQRGQPDTSVPASAFGAPGNANPVVWETYKLAQDVFKSGAATPQPWNDMDGIPPTCQNSVANAGLSHVPVFQMTSKFGDLIPDEVQATGEILVDQQQGLVHYEKRVNEDEYNYIVQNNLFDADQQAAIAMQHGLLLPDGTTQYGKDGAIEIKAAWRIITNEPPDIQLRYKQTTGVIFDPVTNTCSSPLLLGLVGLHIIRKTPQLDQLMWSTFEQVDNVSDTSGNHDPSIPYSFFDPTCTNCVANAKPMPTVTPPATPTLVAVQVERTQSLQQDIISLNLAVWGMITETSPNSVYQYYQLVNVRWPSGSCTVPQANSEIPLDIKTCQFTSSGPQPVSNTTLETYAQQFDCLNCHTGAAVAPSMAAGCKPKLASDFSFVFDDADTPNQFRNSCP